MRHQLTDSVRLIPGVGPKIFEGLALMGIHTFGDIIGWYPRRYIDGSQPTALSTAAHHILLAIRVTISEVKVVRAKRGLTFLDAIAFDDSGEITLRFFNQPYLQKKLQEGTSWVCVGKIETFGKKIQIVNPVLESEPKVIPRYSQTSAVSNRMISSCVEFVLETCDLGDGMLPEELRVQENVVSYAAAMKYVHHPESMVQVAEAREYIATAETFSFFLAILQSKGTEEKQKGIVIPPDVEWLKKVLDSLPFVLTDGQKRVLWDALQELETGMVMTRLINGDVGSGKTVIAGLLAAMVAKAGYKSIILVPTEILAKQHYQSLGSLLSVAGCRVALYTAAQKDDISDADIIIGTHAVLQEGFHIERLGLVVIDEQHRFGVKQRALLRDMQAESPHVLSMTATPIPRTLALVLFADLTVSFLRDKPKDRLPIETRIVYPRDRATVHLTVMRELQAGHQVFVLCPLITEKPQDDDEESVASAADERKTVIAEAERLRTEHPEYGRIEVIHGKMKPAEKREVMDQMVRGEINILVATSVIEVGVDVPNATVMVIENAERYGLAQLHQIRGRVGRGHSQSYCLLCPSHPGGPAIDRLQVLVDTNSGFDIAEADLNLRGPGDIIGLAQSGLPNFRMTSLTNIEFLQHMKEVTEEWVKAHPEVLAQDAIVDYAQVKASLE